MALANPSVIVSVRPHFPVLLSLLLAFTAPAIALGRVAAQESAPASPAQQQPPGQKVSPATLEELVATIEDPERRERLVAELRGLLAASGPREESGAELGGLARYFEQVSGSLSDAGAQLVAQVRRVPEALRGLRATLADAETREPLLIDVGFALGVIAVSVLTSLLLFVVLRRRRAPLEPTAAQAGRRLLPRLGVALLDLLRGVLPAAAALTIALVLLAVVPLTRSAAAIALAVVSAFALQRALRALLRVVLAPEDEGLRLVALQDDAASRIDAALRRLLAVAIWGYFALVAAKASGADVALVETLRNLYALALAVLGIGAVLVLRKRIAESRHERAALPEELDGAALRARPRVWQGATRVAARLWWVVALVYIIGVYLLWLSGIEDGFASALRATVSTVACIGVAAIAASLVRVALRRASAELQAWTATLPEVRRHVPRYVAMVETAFQIVIVLIALGFVLEAWGVGTVGWFESGLARTVVAACLGVLIVVLLALVVMDVSTALTTAYLERRQRQSKDSAKIRTLVPLANKAIKTVVVLLALLTILSQLGVAIGPILASVGFLGLAIGFGAQALVKDLISGVFNLLEDNVSVGDIVKVGETGGQIEAINIRTIQMRDLSGNVHTVPWGQVERLTNFSKGYSCYLIECGVAYREDVDEVIALLREIGADLQRDPDYGPNILEPIEILGLDRFEDSQVVIRARLKTKPLEQWSTGREFNRRMKKVFDERGIEIPFPHRTIYAGVEKDGEAPPLRILNQRAPDASRADDASRAPDVSRADDASRTAAR